MDHEPRRVGGRAAIALVLGLAVFLTGCSTSSEPPSSGPSPIASSPTATATAAPTPSTTLSAEKQEAVDQAADAVRSYWQTYYDILADPTPNLNDLNTVTTQPQLDSDLQSTQALLAGGKTVVKSPGRVTVVDPQVVKVNLASKPPTVTLVACVDTTSVAGTTDGKAWTGGRNEMKYRVVKSSHLPAPGWAVAEVLPPESDLTGSRPC